MSPSPYTLGGNSNAPATSTVISFTLAHAVAAGDALVVSVGTDSAGDIPIVGVTDSVGQTWTQVASDSVQTDAQAVFVCLNAKPMTITDTITGTFSGTAGSKTIVGRGCPGIWTNGAVDVAIVNDNAGSAAPSSGASGALRQSSEWAVAFLINANGGSTPTTWTGGFTAALTEHATNNQYHTVADQVTTATTALTAGATITSAKWCMILVTLRAGPYVSGSNSFAAGTTSTALTASASVAAGDVSFVVCGSGTSGTAPTAVTDSASQTYTLVASQPGTNGMQSYVYAKYNSAALTSGTSTFTATWNNTSGAKYMMALGCNGLATSSAFDQQAGAIGTSTSPSSGATAALAQSSEVGIGVIIGGSAAGSVGFASDWCQLGSTLHSGTYMAVGTKSTSTTSGISATGNLGSSAVWSALAATFSPVAGGGGGGGGGLSISTASPLPDPTVGAAFSDTLVAVNGSPPYIWAVTAGALPPGTTLSTGVSSGSTSAIANVMAVGGPDGNAGMNFSDWQTANATIGPLTGAKLFYSADLPSSWTAAASIPSGGSGTSPKQISDAGGIPIICWNGPSGLTPSSAATINTFLNSIPAGRAVGFSWQQEPENPTSGFSSGSQYVTGFKSIAQVIHGFGNPLLFTVHCATWGQYGPTGRAFDGSYLPSGTDTDVFGMDIYQHQAGGSLNGATSWSTNGLSNNAFWQRYVTLVKPIAAPLGRAMALTEYGIDNTVSASLRNTRLQQDYAYLQNAFGPGGSVSTVPLFCWLYWWHNMAQANNQYKFTDSASESTWKGIAAGSTSSGGSSSGGLLSGTCNTAGTYTFTARVTDATSATASKPFSITVDAAGTLSIVNTSPLAGGTINVPYSVSLTASAGTPTYTWTLLTGSLPSGITLSSAGVLSGTPGAAGTSTFTVKVTDSVANTATAILSITISSALTVSTTSLPSGTVGVPYSQVATAANGTSPYTWGVVTGTLPAGLAIDPDGSVTGTAGTISGTPTAAGVFAFTVQVADSGGATDTQDLTLTISPASGGLPDPGRRVFGGAAGAQAVSFTGNTYNRVPGATFTYYNAFTGGTGTQYTDLTTLGGSPITSVTADANGFPTQFKGPADVLAMYEDANGGAGPRRLVLCDDIGDLLMAVVGAVQGQVGT